jgi:hypothetical protein
MAVDGSGDVPAPPRDAGSDVAAPGARVTDAAPRRDRTGRRARRRHRPGVLTLALNVLLLAFAFAVALVVVAGGWRLAIAIAP